MARVWCKFDMAEDGRLREPNPCGYVDMWVKNVRQWLRYQLGESGLDAGEDRYVAAECEFDMDRCKILMVVFAVRTDEDDSYNGWQSSDTITLKQFCLDPDGARQKVLDFWEETKGELVEYLEGKPEPKVETSGGEIQITMPRLTQGATYVLKEPEKPKPAYKFKQTKRKAEEVAKEFGLTFDDLHLGADPGNDKYGMPNTADESWRTAFTDALKLWPAGAAYCDPAALVKVAPPAEPVEPVEVQTEEVFESEEKARLSDGWREQREAEKKAELARLKEELAAKVVTAPNVKLEAVGIDTDGTVQPLENLTRPAAGKVRFGCTLFDEQPGPLEAGLDDLKKLNSLMTEHADKLSKKLDGMEAPKGETCGECRGTGKYQPLVGPAEDCQTCGGCGRV